MTAPVQNRPPSITLTGADEKTDVSSLAQLDAEIGLLYTTSPEGRNRYPRWGWICDAASHLPRAALHVCGREARKQLLNGHLDVSWFQRIQVNGTVAAADVERLCRQNPGHTIITQHCDANDALLAVAADNHAVLIDASGGRGVSPVRWHPPATEKAVGFAGGLGADNLATELNAIHAVAQPGWWVDMESKLRVDDWFSLEQAAECVAVFRAAMRVSVTPRTWPEYAWPDWVPAKVRLDVESFWSGGPADWRGNMKLSSNRQLPLGTEVEIIKYQRILKGRWVATSNDMGRLILADGKAVVASTGDILNATDVRAVSRTLVDAAMDGASDALGILVSEAGRRGHAQALAHLQSAREALGRAVVGLREQDKEAS